MKKTTIILPLIIGLFLSVHIGIYYYFHRPMVEVERSKRYSTELCNGVCVVTYLWIDNNIEWVNYRNINSPKDSVRKDSLFAENLLRQLK